MANAGLQAGDINLNALFGGGENPLAALMALAGYDGQIAQHNARDRSDEPPWKQLHVRLVR